jgi:hypothetical protein
VIALLKSLRPRPNIRQSGRSSARQVSDGAVMAKSINRRERLEALLQAANQPIPPYRAKHRMMDARSSAQGGSDEAGDVSAAEVVEILYPEP